MIVRYWISSKYFQIHYHQFSDSMLMSYAFEGLRYSIQLDGNFKTFTNLISSLAAVILSCKGTGSHFFFDWFPPAIIWSSACTACTRNQVSLSNFVGQFYLNKYLIWRAMLKGEIYKDELIWFTYRKFCLGLLIFRRFAHPS